jgi:ribosomal protein S21
MYVEVRGDKDTDFTRALHQFTRQVKRAELMDILKKRTHYLKPSLKQKHKRADALRRRKRDARKAAKKSNNTF